MLQRAGLGLLLMGCGASLGWGSRSSAAQEADSLETLRGRLGSPDTKEREVTREKMQEQVEIFYLQLAEGLASDDLEIRKGTAEVLKGIPGRFRFAALLCRLPVADRAHLRELRSSNPSIFEQLTSDNPDSRKKGCVALSSVADPLVTPLLCALTLDSDPQVLRSAIKALGKVGSVEALPRLMALAEMPADPATEPEAPRGPTAMITIGGMSLGGDVDRRPIHQVAIEAIGQLQHPQAAGYLIQKLGKPEPGGLSEYLIALGKTGQSDLAVPALMALLEDDRSLSQLEAARSGKKPPARNKGNKARLLEPTVGDLALCVMVKLTGQKGEEYGQFNADHAAQMAGPFSAPTLQVKPFKDLEARRQAVAKLKTWYEGWSKHEPAKEKPEPAGEKQAEP